MGVCYSERGVWGGGLMRGIRIKEPSSSYRPVVKGCCDGVWSISCRRSQAIPYWRINDLLVLVLVLYGTVLVE